MSIITLSCWEVDTLPTRIFPVRIDLNERWGSVKDGIKKKKEPQFNDIAADELDLWKITINSSQIESLLGSKDYVDNITKVNPLNPLGALSMEVKHSLPGDHDNVDLIIVRRPPRKSSSTISPSSPRPLKRPHSPDYLDSGSKRLRTDIAPQDGWITELHSKIWGQEHLRQQLFHTVRITEAHYETLQKRLADLDSELLDHIVSTKLSVLLSPSAPGLATHPNPSDDEQVEAENDEVVDAEHSSIFPETIEFLDLSSLELRNWPPRLPLPLLVRQEYKAITEILNGLPRNGSGSSIISGQPGTGKTAYLHLRLVDFMLMGSPFLYQSITGNVYHVSDVVKRVETWASLESIEAFIDGDYALEPKPFIYHNPQVRIIVASPPEGAAQKWLNLKRLPFGSFVQKYVVGLWSAKELFLAGIFLTPHKLSYERLKESTFYFGFNPRQCFGASIGPTFLRQIKNEVRNKIHAMSKMDLQDLLTATTLTSLPDMLFELFPADDLRVFYQARVGAVSPWALNILLETFEARKVDAVGEFFDSLRTDPYAQSLREP